jgi:hypothetical protein
MATPEVVRRIVGPMSAAFIVLGVGGCSSDYDSYMSGSCDGLRAMATAYETKDQDAFAEGYDQVHGYVPAGEEAVGDSAREAEVDAVWKAQRLLHVAAYAPAELNNGASIWEGHDLTDEDKATVQEGVEACADH